MANESPEQDPIGVFVAVLGQADGDYLKINAVYRGECEDLGRKTLEVPHSLIPRLEEAGFTAYPIIYYISKSDWDEHPE